jgi:hypothetical protein
MGCLAPIPGRLIELRPARKNGQTQRFRRARFSGRRQKKIIVTPIGAMKNAGVAYALGRLPGFSGTPESRAGGGDP